MDNPEQLTVLSLCSGYGGIEIGLERVLGSVRVLAHVEIEAFAIANLVNKMETGRMVPAPVWTDLKTFPAHLLRGRVNILAGGYPCQPFSAAGKRQGESDPRHLFPHIKEIIEQVEPDMCFFENVDGHVSMGLSTVISDLEEMGYETTWGVFSAAEVGAPHQRKRVFILAYRVGTDRRPGAEEADEYDRSDRRREETHSGPELCSEELANRGSTRSTIGISEPGQRKEGDSEELNHDSGGSRWPSRPGEEQHEWEEPRVVAESVEGGKNRPVSKGGHTVEVRAEERQTQPQLGRTPDGRPGGVDPALDRVDRLRLLGNGVVPQTAEKAFRVLIKRFTG